MSEPHNIELLSHRIRRLYAGLDRVAPALADSEPPRVWRSDKLVYIAQDFRGGRSVDQIREFLTQIAYNIAHIKDPLKKYLEQRGRNRRVVEECINYSESLKLICDIANREKHGYPGDRSSRSGRDPYLGEVGRSLRMQSGPTVGSSLAFSINPLTGQQSIRSTGGASASIIFWGEIRDKDGKVIGDLLDFAKEGVADWEHFFSAEGISL